MPELFHCPSDVDSPEGATNYVAVVGNETMWPMASGRKRDEVKDGDTILIVEAKGLNIPWLEPRDLEFATMNLQVNSPLDPGIGSHHRGGALVWMEDGSRRFLRDATPSETVRAR